MTGDELIAEAARRISRAAPGARVVVFRFARSRQALANSDLDLLIVEPEVTNAAHESVRLRRVLRGLPAAIDAVVVSQSYADEWRDVRGSLVHTALSEGRVVVD